MATILSWNFQFYKLGSNFFNFPFQLSKLPV